MNRTTIEYLDFTWNPVTGCTKGCKYCYAQRWAHRLAGRYGYPKENPFQPIFHEDRLLEPTHRQKPSIIGVAFMGELFDPHITIMQILQVLAVIRKCPQHIFIILTKQIFHAGMYDFPPNVWLGMSVDGVANDGFDIPILLDTNATIKFISFEPLLNYVKLNLIGIDWAIIGAQTNPTIRNQKAAAFLIEDLREHNIPIFMKDNMHWHPFPGPREWPSAATQEEAQPE